MTSLTFTESLREFSGKKWDRVVNHKFTDDLAKGEIDHTVLKKYLVQDFRFLDAFVVLLASVIANGRSLEDRIPGCHFLAMITGKENTYFERSFQVLKCSAEERAKTPDAEVTVKFCNLMREVALKGTLGEMLSVLVVAEWIYQSWGERVLPYTNRDNFITYEWVDLHSGAYFAEVVSYLRKLLDKEGEILDEEGKTKCRDAFLLAIELEQEFFDMAYND